MIITKEYNELISDLINARIDSDDDISLVMMVMDLFRYGFDGYLNYSREKLINEALKLKLYGPDVDGIDIK